LHRFVIHGREYGISSVGGPDFRDDAAQVRLGELGLRLGERSSYEYNYCAAWEVHLRVEEILPSQPGPAYPRCVGGRRAGPPEGLLVGRGSLWNEPSPTWYSARSSARRRS
jgi:Plasmid pRiA4b ORF-3-like protein